jgi:hypothetical protein
VQSRLPRQRLGDRQSVSRGVVENRLPADHLSFGRLLFHRSVHQIS